MHPPFLDLARERRRAAVETLSDYPAIDDLAQPNVSRESLDAAIDWLAVLHPYRVARDVVIAHTAMVRRMRQDER